jgi:lysozyme family protein
MNMYPEEFEKALTHAMLYEVGGNFKLTPEVLDGLIETRSQRIAVGYVNHPNDPGGETKFGIAKRANPNEDITNLKWHRAKEIYYQEYWLAGSCDKITSKRIRIIHFDGCVNHGVSRACKFLQRAVGVIDDGVIGPKSLTAINSANDIEVCKKISEMRIEFYKNIVQRDISQRIFLNGWLRRITEITNYVIK